MASEALTLTLNPELVAQNHEILNPTPQSPQP